MSGAGDQGVFDRLAADYDRSFSDRQPALWLRQRVLELACTDLPTAARVLDMGCGTGADSLRLASAGHSVTAADASVGMLEQLRHKLAATDHDTRERIRVLQLDARDMPDEIPGAPFDLVLANFGVLNCIEDPGPFLAAIRQQVQPTGTLALTIMGKFCLWEMVGFALRGNLRRAGRRWRRDAVYEIDGQRQAVWFHSPRAIAALAGPSFRVAGIHGIGVFLPPSEFFAVCERRPGLGNALAKMDAASGSWWPLNRLGDHYLIRLRRAGP